MQIIEFGGVVPERENLPYYLVSMKWFTRWQKYTGCFKVESDSEDDVLPVKDKSKLILGEYPGELNPSKEVKEFAYIGNRNNNQDFILLTDDFYGHTYLRKGKKEDQDFKVLDEQVWNRLYKKYGGREIRRHSVAVQTENPLRPDYVVEVVLRRFKLLTYPKVKYFSTAIEL